MDTSLTRRLDAIVALLVLIAVILAAGIFVAGGIELLIGVGFVYACILLVSWWYFDELRESERTIES